MTRPSAVHLDTGSGPRCGHPTAPHRSTDENAVTCTTCLSLIAGTHHLGVRWADPKPHGTIAAYKRHYRNGEKPCEPCRQAEARRWADRSEQDSARRRNHHRRAA